ncbi:MAG TPA: hypothetical protein VFB21_13425 [Chthonomonadaceae bacterium]|nr:hypothetical protein [Chthonomonadaceae bacterium]
MASNEEQAGELLWRYIEELKQADNPDDFHFVARTPVNPAEMAGLLPVADAVLQTLKADISSEEGRTAARARLVETIRTERAASEQRNGHSARRRFTWPQFAWNRQAVLVMILLLLLLTAIGLAMWQDYQRSCHASGPPQSSGPASSSTLRVQPMALRASGVPSLEAALQPSFQKGSRLRPVLSGRCHDSIQ